MTTAVQNDTVSRIVNFLNDIGIRVTFGTLEKDTVLPGISIENEGLFVDESRLLYPGDLLHEAGHIAVAPPDYRKTLNGHIDPQEDFKHAGELMTLAWSYAAAVHLDLDPAVVFHEHGYKGDSQQLIDNFRYGYGIGVPGLQWAGMTAIGERAAELGVQPFPHMIRWVRE